MSGLYRFRVTGRVQGVGFRQATQAEARARGLNGWVRNTADGAVEGLASGDDSALAALRAWLARGPALARVATLQWNLAQEDDAQKETAPDGFEIRR